MRTALTWTVIALTLTAWLVQAPPARAAGAGVSTIDTTLSPLRARSPYHSTR